MKETLKYHTKEYTCRWIDVNGRYDLIGPECLEKSLIDKDSGYVSHDARCIDEMICFYVPDCLMEENEFVIREYVLQHVC